MSKELILGKIANVVIQQKDVHTGLFPATEFFSKTGYDRAWIRDNCYVALGFKESGYHSLARSTIKALLKLFLKHEYKIDWAIKEKPDAPYKFIHPRYHLRTASEVDKQWGFIQNDSIGLFLFCVSKMVRQLTEDEKRILEKVVKYLGSIEYWSCNDNGIWEDHCELHASSLGACVAGLKAVRKFVDVPDEFIRKGEEALNRLLPMESNSKPFNMSLLSLIYPFGIITGDKATNLLNRIRATLVRSKGLIRYYDDKYHMKDDFSAEWPLGFAWLSCCYRKLGDEENQEIYARRALDCVIDCKIPELYFGGTDTPNDNTPLLWAHAMTMIALSEGGKK